MLALPTGRTRFCDGVTRRSALQIGALSLGAASFTLADLFRHEARAAAPKRHKAVINITLGGGPPHQDMWDLKPDAPAEIRGEFKPIKTNVAGLEICELLPRIARLADRCAVLRSIVGAEARHDTFQCLSGWKFDELRAMEGHPSIGSVVAKLQGSTAPGLPPFLGLNRIGTWRSCGPAGFLGQAYEAFAPEGPALGNMTLRNVSAARFHDRRELLQSFDTMRRDVDASGRMDATDSADRQALEVLTSTRLADALDLSKEDPRVRDRYGDGKPYGRFILDGSPTANENFLLARRLVEAGVRCVTVPYGRWDSHLDNFEFMRDHGPKFDQAFSALIEDLELRGLLDDVTVIAWGEFGRTPRINKDAGRDHWVEVNSAILAGGGMKVGQVIGSTNRYAEMPKDRPISFQEVVATLYHNLGIEAQATAINDPTGRPQHILDDGPLRELVGEA